MPVGAMTPPYIATLSKALANIARDQRSYHTRNRERLTLFHRRLDMMSIFSVAIAAILSGAYICASAAGWLFREHLDTFEPVLDFLAHNAAFFGSVGPAVAAAAAGIRYHGDYERFALRSEKTCSALEILIERADGLCDRADDHGAEPSHDRPPLFEDLVELMLDMRTALDEDLSDWRFTYSARPMPLP